MSMEDLWLRQSVHGWVLFLGIKSVYTTKVKEITEASASVGLLLATAVIRINSRDVFYFTWFHGYIRTRIEPAYFSTELDDFIFNAIPCQEPVDGER